MTEFLPLDYPYSYALPLLLVVLLLLLFLLVYRGRRRADRSVAGVFGRIAFERIDGLVVPNADEGEIQIDHLLLTPSGLLIVDVKDVHGAVFGSDKMQDWTVISTERRFTFANPQPALYDRIAAIRELVQQVPVYGRILFLDGATFKKGVPGLVCTLDQLVEEFGESDKATAKAKVEAFKAQWKELRRKAVESSEARLMRYKHR